MDWVRLLDIQRHENDCLVPAALFDGEPLASMPDGLKLSVFEEGYPDLDLWRKGDRLTVLLGEPIMSPVQDENHEDYWMADAEARRFVFALRDSLRVERARGIAVSTLKGCDMQEHCNYSAWWYLYFPLSMSGREVLERSTTHLNEVWARAERYFLGLRGALLLGRDAGDGLAVLYRIREQLGKVGVAATIIKEQPDILGETVIQKVLRHALASEFIVLENSAPSGHLYEFPHLKLAECPTAILQRQGSGATWMFEDAYAGHKFWRKFTYTEETLPSVVTAIVTWGEQYRRDLSAEQIERLPWFKETTGRWSIDTARESGPRQGVPTRRIRLLPRPQRPS